MRHHLSGLVVPLELLLNLLDLRAHHGATVLSGISSDTLLKFKELCLFLFIENTFMSLCMVFQAV